MRRTTIRTATGTAAALLALGGLALAAPADAAVAAHGDTHHDVVSTGPDGDQPAPGNRTADILKLRSAHTARSVTATMVLDRLATDSYGLVWQVKTAAPGRWTVQITKFGQSKDFSLQHHGKAVACPGLAKTVTRSTGTVRVVVPRSCLGTPAWVQVGGGAFVAAPDGSTLADDALLDGRIHQSGLELGPRLAAG
ncbi:MAG: hypothetical protein ACXVW0_14720 [Nocardioides sp.]